MGLGLLLLLLSIVCLWLLHIPLVLLPVAPLLLVFYATGIILVPLRGRGQKKKCPGIILNIPSSLETVNLQPLVKINGKWEVTGAALSMDLAFQGRGSRREWE